MRDDRSLVNFLKLVKEFGLLSGLKINFEKSEIMFLGNQDPAVSDDYELCNIKVKKALKTLGLYFSYDYRLKQKLNFDEIIDSIKTK